jgi:hypothetical protein
MIARIIDIEKQSAARIEEARTASQKKVEARRRALQEEKERERAKITEKENARFANAVQQLTKQTEESSQAEMRDYETIFQDDAKIAAVKEKIISILLGR